MTIRGYLKDRCLLLLLHACCMLALAGFLNMTGYQRDYLFLVLVCWMLVLAAVLGVSWYRRKQYFCRMGSILERADQRYLLGELMPEAFSLEDSIYREMIRVSNKSAIEKIREIEKERKEYREFVESWVHEIKAPITGISLICENHKGEYTGRIGGLNRKVESLVETALYYARSDEVYKDYMIRETDLQELVSEVLARNKYYLIQNGITAEVACTETVYTDEKWISFILNQLILNSVKYKRDTDAQIRIYTGRYERGVRLTVEDNGIGIKEEELSRIFEKGFTGSNGRRKEHATGMGLYLCQVLCGKLGIRLHVVSAKGEGTKMMLEFPVGNYLTVL